MTTQAKDHGISSASLNSVDRWIAALRSVPAAAKVYEVTPRRAELEFGITSALADLLAERGLPRSSFDGEARYSWGDLHYIALRLGSARIYLRTMRSWADSLMEIARSGSRMTWLRYRTYAAPGTGVDVLLPEGHATAVIGPDQVAAAFNVRMASLDITFPPTVQPLLHEAAALDFYLPDTLSGDLDFARRTGLADCVTASMILVSECLERGIEARMAGGLILAPPLGTEHQWAEIRVGDTWAPADPLLLSVLVRFAGLDSSRWSCTDSPNAILLRLSDSEPSIVNAADGPVETSFMVSVAEQG